MKDTTPQIIYKVAICPRVNLPYIQITSIVLPYSQSTKYLVGTYCPGENLPYIQITSIVLPYIQSTNYLVGTYLSQRKSTLYPDHPYRATLYPIIL